MRTPSKYKSAKTGQFMPRHPEKYKGKHPIVFKSLLEAKFMIFLDNNPKCTKWAYESIVVPYFDKSTNRQRQYYVDFVVEMNESPITKTIYWIETKNAKETVKPTGQRNSQALLESTKTYVCNLCKWEAATKIAKRYGAKFVVVTDEFFKGKMKF